MSPPGDSASLGRLLEGGPEPGPGRGRLESAASSGWSSTACPSSGCTRPDTARSGAGRRRVVQPRRRRGTSCHCKQPGGAR